MAVVEELLLRFNLYWAVVVAIITVIGFVIRRLRRTNTLCSERIQEMSDQLGEVGSAVRAMETEIVRLTERLEGAHANSFEHVLTMSKQAKTFLEQQAAIKSMGDCFQYNSPYLAEVSATLARFYLEAYCASGDITQLAESKRLATLANLAEPAKVDFCALRAEVAMTLASSATSREPGRLPDDTWDEALELLRRSEPNVNDEERFFALEKLGTKFREEGQFELAGAALRAAYSTSERVFGSLSRQSISALNNVATNFSDRKLPELAKPIFEELVGMQKNYAGYFDEDSYRLKCAAIACDLKLLGGDSVLASVEALVSDGIDRFGVSNKWVLKAQNSLAVCLGAVGREAESEELYRKIIKQEVRILGSNHINPLSTRRNLAMLLMKLGRKDEAIAELSGVIQQLDRNHRLTQEWVCILEEMQASPEKT